MQVNSIFGLAGAIVTVALVTTIVTRGKESAAVIKAAADGFSGSLRAAQGR